MRQLSLQEVEVVSGGADKAVVDFGINDLLQWGAAYLGGQGGFAAASGSALATSNPLTIPYFGVSATKWGLGGLGGFAGAVAGYALGHYLGQLFNTQVVPRVGG